MGGFLTYFFEILLLTCAPPVLLGLAVWGCRQLYCMLVGYRSGRSMQMAVSVLSTPLRELGHVIVCMVCLHRIDDMRLINIHDPDGELGFVEHSYNPRNPVAVLGNFLYALGPVLTGLCAVLLIFLTCFYGVLPPFFETVAALGESGAGLGAYVKAALSLIPAMFGAGGAHVMLRILGCLLLLLLCMGIHVSLSELKDALSGFAVFSVLAALAVLVLMLFDSRVIRIAFAGLRSYATAVTALFIVVLLAAAALVAVGFVFGALRTLFGWDLPRERE